MCQCVHVLFQAYIPDFQAIPIDCIGKSAFSILFYSFESRKKKVVNPVFSVKNFFVIYRIVQIQIVLLLTARSVLVEFSILSKAKMRRRKQALLL